MHCGTHIVWCIFKSSRSFCAHRNYIKIHTAYFSKCCILVCYSKHNYYIHNSTVLLIAMQWTPGPCFWYLFWLWNVTFHFTCFLKMFSKCNDNHHIIYIWAGRQNNPVSQSAVQPSVSGKSILLSNSFDYHFKHNKRWHVTRPAPFVRQISGISQTVWL